MRNILLAFLILSVLFVGSIIWSALPSGGKRVQQLRSTAITEFVLYETARGDWAEQQGFPIDPGVSQRAIMACEPVADNPAVWKAKCTGVMFATSGQPIVVTINTLRPRFADHSGTYQIPGAAGSEFLAEVRRCHKLMVDSRVEGVEH